MTKTMVVRYPKLQTVVREEPLFIPLFEIYIRVKVVENRNTIMNELMNLAMEYEEYIGVYSTDIKGQMPAGIETMDEFVEYCLQFYSLHVEELNVVVDNILYAFSNGTIPTVLSSTTMVTCSFHNSYFLVDFQ